VISEGKNEKKANTIQPHILLFFSPSERSAEKTKGKLSLNNLKTVHANGPDRATRKSHDLTVDNGLGKT
jgi:hypothetical protein